MPVPTNSGDNKPVDALGRELKVSTPITYASTEGRAAVLRFGIIEEIKKNSAGVWKIKVLPVYDPGSYRGVIPDDAKTRRRSIEAKSKIFAIGMTCEELREHVKRLDSIARLSR